MKEFGVESAEAYRHRIDPGAPETPTPFKFSTNTQINKRRNQTHSEHIIEQARNIVFIFFKQEESKKKGVSGKLFFSQKEVTQQAGQIQIQVKSDPVGSHRIGH